MPRPLPSFPEPDSEPFWRATKNHELKYQKCDHCNSVVFYPRLHCNNCGSGDVSWHTSAGVGTVYTFSIVRQNRSPFFRDMVPYIVAWIDLDEGFRMMSNVVGVEKPEDVHCGMRVKLQWEDQEELSFPLFSPI
ncbi:MAG: Zn-ribbon domain-containing OB-fold protein [Chloroflexi bacterium]|nr:Zn-ribbon domain-containing OB-fold protein [Chloroflexota bacterium]